MNTTESQRKGLRFEVEQAENGQWNWVLIGKDGPVCVSYESFVSEANARANIAKSKGRLKASGYAKVVTVRDDDKS